MEQVQVGKTYKHFKGNLYKVICVAKSSETLEEHVVYETLYENPQGRIWVRPLSMFQEWVDVSGNKVRRFSLIAD
ncbi:MAG: DUF1653 domain-containing protein [Pseudobdellovibrio sp.]